MPPKKARHTNRKVSRSAQGRPVEEQQQPADPPQSPPPYEEECGTSPDLTPQLEPEPGFEKAEETGEEGCAKDYHNSFRGGEGARNYLGLQLLISK